MNKEYNIKELLDSIDFNKNKLTKVNDKLMLTNYQIEVLKDLTSFQKTTQAYPA